MIVVVPLLVVGVAGVGVTTGAYSIGGGGGGMGGAMGAPGCVDSGCARRKRERGGKRVCEGEERRRDRSALAVGSDRARDRGRQDSGVACPGVAVDCGVRGADPAAARSPSAPSAGPGGAEQLGGDSGYKQMN